MQERHQLDQLFAEMLTNIVTDMPPDPVQYIIDAATYSCELAKQVGRTAERPQPARLHGGIQGRAYKP